MPSAPTIRTSVESISPCLTQSSPHAPILLRPPRFAASRHISSHLATSHHAPPYRGAALSRLASRSIAAACVRHAGEYTSLCRSCRSSCGAPVSLSVTRHRAALQPSHTHIPSHIDTQLPYPHTSVPNFHTRTHRYPTSAPTHIFWCRLCSSRRITSHRLSITLILYRHVCLFPRPFIAIVCLAHPCLSGSCLSCSCRSGSCGEGGGGSGCGEGGGDGGRW